MYKTGERSYVRGVVNEVIARIKENPNQDPLAVLHQFILWIDGICSPKDGQPITNEFTKNVVWICDNLEQYLWEHESEEENHVEHRLDGAFQTGAMDHEKTWRNHSDGNRHWRNAYNDRTGRIGNAGGDAAH